MSVAWSELARICPVPGPHLGDRQKAADEEPDMSKTYRLDIRYIPESGVNALRRVQRLTESISAEDFDVTDIAVQDDGARVSLLVSTDGPVHSELILLNLVSKTGSIGRFSCRETERSERESLAASAEAALA